jgi:hypothetical protein
MAPEWAAPALLWFLLQPAQQLGNLFRVEAGQPLVAEETGLERRGLPNVGKVRGTLAPGTRSTGSAAEIHPKRCSW